MPETAQLAAWALLFFALSLAILWGAWRAYTPVGAYVFLLRFVAMGFGIAFAVNSTMPSSAPRLRARGIISAIDEYKQGRSSTYTVHLNTNGGTTLALRAEPTPPFFAVGRDLVDVVYLTEHSAGHPDRAISFKVLTGPRAGEGDSVSADWIGRGWAL